RGPIRASPLKRALRYLPALTQRLCCKDWRQSEVAVALRRSGGCCEMVVEHAHGLRQRRGPNAKSSLHKAHLAPDAGLQAPGASLSFAQGSHDFESLDRGIGRGDRFETAHRLDQYLELSVIGLDHV